MAGSDTTAIAFRATMLYILTSPHTLNTLRSEIDTFTAQNPPADSNTIISDTSTRTLPYLQACIREGLRMHPPIPALNSKQVPPQGDTINGIFVPGGTRIGYGSFSIQRNKSVFGEDAKFFRPERWLEATGSELQRMERTNDLVFGSGKYQCLGKSVAYVELRKFIFEVNSSFFCSENLARLTR
jgi:cytochrome P450